MMASDAAPIAVFDAEYGPVEVLPRLIPRLGKFHIAGWERRRPGLVLNRPEARLVGTDELLIVGHMTTLDEWSRVKDTSLYPLLRLVFVPVSDGRKRLEVRPPLDQRPDCFAQADYADLVTQILRWLGGESP
jgi:hypothetical protein